MTFSLNFGGTNAKGQGIISTAPGDRRDPNIMSRHKALALLNAKVEKDLSREENNPAQKALFLGTGESGKSTVFKQMRLCYGDSFDEFERQQYSKLIWADTLRAIRILVDICDEERNTKDGDQSLREIVVSWLGDPEVGSDPNNLQKHVQLIQSLTLTRHAFLEAEVDINARAFLHNHVASGNKGLNLEMPENQWLRETAPEYLRKPILRQAVAGHAISSEATEAAMGRKTALEPPSQLTRVRVNNAVVQLWMSCPDKIKRMVSANQLGLETNASFFLDKAQNYRDPRYLATDEDILHARIKTTGITTAEFSVKSNKLVVMDVGGQRVERKKWIHSFDDVSCILFVASISEYDQGLEEEGSVNRLDEALEVFDQTVNSQWFRAKSVQLFLNKVDILQQKCHYSSFTAHFPSYEGSDSDPEEITRYIESLFRSRFRPGSRNLYVHRTCATDTTTMKFVIDAVSDMILFENLKWAGMV